MATPNFEFGKQPEGSNESAAEMSGSHNFDVFVTATGRYHTSKELLPSGIEWEDLRAVMLNNTLFGGHVIGFYSIAQHAMLTSLCFERPKYALAALLLPAGEAMVGDLIEPALAMIPPEVRDKISEYKKLYALAIFKRLKLHLSWDEYRYIRRREATIWHATRWMRQLNRQKFYPFDYGTMLLMEGSEEIFQRFKELATGGVSAVNSIRRFGVEPDTMRTLFDMAPQDRGAMYRLLEDRYAFLRAEYSRADEDRLERLEVDLPVDALLLQESEKAALRDRDRQIYNEHVQNEWAFLFDQREDRRGKELF